MASSLINIDRIVAIIAAVIALAGAGYSVTHNQNSLEYMTKQDFNAFQIDNVKKMTSLEGTVQNGFSGVAQQLANLNFVATKDFQDFKDKTTASQFELQRAIDLLKKDLENLQKKADTNTQKIAEVEKKLAILEALRGKE